MRVLATTWPAETTQQEGPSIFRKSPGGGKRVNATAVTAPVSVIDVSRAEERMQGEGQTLLFQVESGSDLDTILAENGYEMVDETLLYHMPIDGLADMDLPSVTAFPIWPPLQIMRDIWACGGIGEDRVAIMERAACEKTTILGRVDGRAAASVYVGLHEGCAMVHALEVLCEHRRKGLARFLMIAAAKWSMAQGAHHIALLVTAKNKGANALYQSLGMVAEPGYHYRIKAE